MAGFAIDADTMRSLVVETEVLLEENGDVQDRDKETRHKRIKLGLAVAVPLGVLILLGLYKRASYLLQVESQDAIREDSELAQCLPCHKECRLRWNQWTTCPADKPYFSELHCKCVASRVCADDSPRVLQCSVCQNCFKHACHIGGEYVTCNAINQYYVPQTSVCQQSCPVQLTGVQPVNNRSALPVRIPFSCPRATYGTCSIFGCAKSRGATTCSSGECVCQPGYCAHRGTCIPEASYDQEEHSCQHNTFHTCRIHSCASSLGEVSCDGWLSGGAGTYNCLCKDDHCFDPTTNVCTKKSELP